MPGRSTDALRESVAYNSVLDTQFADWYTALLLSVIASALSYYCTALYADLVRVWRRQRADARTARAAALAKGTRSAATLGSHDDLDAHAPDVDRETPTMRATATHVTAVKTLAVLRFVVLFVTFVVLDFVALAVLPLTLVVPTAMLVFIWGGAYRWLSGALAATRDRLVLVLVLALVAVGVWAAPKGLYIVRVKRVVVWDARSALYSAAFAGGALLLLVARTAATRRARALRMALARAEAEARARADPEAGTARAAASARALRRARASDKGARDATTVASALLTGALGGQALVLLKLVAEICDEAVFGDDAFQFAGTAVFLVVCFSAAASALHVAAFHFALARLEHSNVRLFVPVHRMSLIASASVGAAVYLQEWNVPEGSLQRAAVYYCVSLAGLLGVCALLARQALRGNPLDLFRPPGLVDDRDDDVDADGGEEAESHAHAGVTAGAGAGGSASTPRELRELSDPEPTSASLWALGARDESFGGRNSRAEDSDSDDSGQYFMARARHPSTAAATSAAACEPDGVGLELPGYDSDESFHSAMDDDSASVATGDSASEGVLAVAPSAVAPSPTAQMAVLDEQYPVPRDTMVFPRRMNTGRSFWDDAGLQPGGWRVRGPTYDADRVKVPCGEARMRIAAFEWIFAPDVPFKHMAARADGFVARHHAGRTDRPFLLILNFAIPSVGHYVTYLARRRDVRDAVFDGMLQRFVDAGDDAHRNARLKLIPGVSEGSFLVRRAVGAKPALLCQKLTTTYFRGDNYLEACIDVGSSVVGSKIFAAVKGFASGLTLHLGVVLESKTRKELPERLMSGVDIHSPVMHPLQAPSPVASDALDLA